MAEVEPVQRLQRRGPRLLFGNDLLLAGMLRALGLLGLLARRFDAGPRAFAFGVAEVRLEV